MLSGVDLVVGSLQLDAGHAETGLEEAQIEIKRERIGRLAEMRMEDDSRMDFSVSADHDLTRSSFLGNFPFLDVEKI